MLNLHFGYSADSGAGGGFVAHPDGYSAQITVPAASPACANQTIPESINASGTIAGWYTTNYFNASACPPQNTGGFVMSPDGELTLFALPGTNPPLPQYNLPLLSNRISIDQAGDITGFFADAAGGRTRFRTQSLWNHHIL